MSNTDLLYMLCEAGRLNLMYLPSGAVAWLFDRPVHQVDSAEKLGVAARNADNPIIDSTLLRSDQNVLILKCEGGQKFRIYPDGGYSFDGQPMGFDGCVSALENIPDHETCPCACGAVEGCDDFDYQDELVVIDVPTEGIGGETTLEPQHGWGTGSPYSDVASDIIGQNDIYNPDEEVECPSDYDYNELDELARALGTMEYASEGIILEEDRLSFEDLKKKLSR
jgi:hypothetical protein